MRAVNRAIRAPALAWGPAERAGHTREIPIRLDQDFPTIIGTQDVGAVVAGFEGDVHAAVRTSWAFRRP